VVIPTMAKQKPAKSEGGKERVRKSAPVQVKPDLAEWIAVIADHDDVTQYEFLDGRLREWVKGHYERVLREKNERWERQKRDAQEG
jgi:hypothetical protein